MKALSIRNPYAGLIAAGIKNIENRTWNTNYAGMLAICSSQKPDAEQYVRAERRKVKQLGKTYPERLCSINGHILAVVDFRYMAWIRDDGKPDTDHPTIKLAEVTDWWDRDCLGWIFENPRILAHPIPIKGKLGLWNLPPEIEREVLGQLPTQE